ncbi:MAG: hypothetical protein Q7W45_13910 [Bacteroidota bacterium]|nr:hypothetical protein [Bacteroidota bacterium]MDP3555940.1 hypothetical protein [Bacteroidota bacterium]
MKKTAAILLIIFGSVLVIYALMVLVNCFALLSSTEFNNVGIGYSLGTLFGPLLLLAVARWLIRKGVKTYKAELLLKKKQL